MTTPKLNDLLRRYAGTAKAESTFWQGVVASTAPPRAIWGLDLHPGRGPLSVGAYVYLVDSSTLWLAAAAIDPAHLEKLLAEDGHDRAVQTPTRARAAGCIQAASDAGEVADPESSVKLARAFSTSLAAIAASPAYAKSQRVPRTVTAHHHWFLILYRLADGGRVAGLGHVLEPTPGMLDRDSALDCLESIVQMDLGSKRTLVHEAVTAAGGVCLADALKHLKIS